jgi:hypothetical protein
VPLSGTEAANALVLQSPTVNMVRTRMLGNQDCRRRRRGG